MVRACSRVVGLLLLLIPAGFVGISCGSSDSKKAAPRKDYQGDAGALGSGGTSDPSSGGSSSDAGQSSQAGAPGSGATAGDGSGQAGAGAAGAPSDGCPVGYANCDDSDPDCETQVDTVVACGACDISCDAVHGTPICEDLKCVVPPGECDALYGDCDEDGRNGCETPLADDATNCGACGRTCEGDTPCDNGSCALVKVIEEPAAANSSWDFRFVDDKVFFLRIDGVHYTPQNPPELPATSTLVASSSPVSLTNDDDYIYWIRDTQPVTIRRLAADASGNIGIVNDAAAGYIDPYYNLIKLVLTPTGFVFPTGYYDPTPRSIMALAKGATATPTPLLTGRGVIRNLSLFAGQLVWQEDGSNNSNIYTMPLNGEPEDVKLVDSCSYNCSFASDGQYLYYVHAVSLLGKVNRYDLSDPEAEPEALAFDLSLNNGVLVDEQYVYYDDISSGHRLMRLMKDGSAEPELVTVLPNNGNPYGFVHVDDTYVWLQYFEDLFRTPK